MDKCGRNGEGYADATAGTAIWRVMKEERKRDMEANGKGGAAPLRQAAGTRNRAAGELFEKWLSAACDFYWSQGVACIEKTPEPMKPIRPYGSRGAGQFIACYTRQAQPDFKGALCDGTCIIFDAKHTDKDRIQQGAVTERQWELFDRYERMGAKCYVVVSIRLASFYRVPWDVWKRMKELFGHKHMADGEELAPYQVPDRNCTVLFLEGVELRDEDVESRAVDLCQYFGHKKLKGYADFFNSSSSFCWGVI